MLTMIQDPGLPDILRRAVSTLDDIEIVRVSALDDLFDSLMESLFFLVVVESDPSEKPLENLVMRIGATRRLDHTPLLVLTDKASKLPAELPGNTAWVDCMVMQKKTVQLELAARIRLYHELFKQRQAVARSIEELDNIYARLARNQDAMNFHKAVLYKTAFSTATFATKLDHSLRMLKSSLHGMEKHDNLPAGCRPYLSGIRTVIRSVRGIAASIQAGKRSGAVMETIQQQPEEMIRVLAVLSSSDDFNMLRHALNQGMASCLKHAETLEQAFVFVTDEPFDLVFSGDSFFDGTGFDFLDYLRQIRSNIPVIYVTGKSEGDKAARAVSKGAYDFMFREDISIPAVSALVKGTFEKAALEREVSATRHRIEMLSSIDHLTRLNTKKCFDETLELEIARSRRYELPLSILIVDFDHFRNVNETCGYPDGNTALAVSAGIIESTVRSHDVVCRYGGEEFGVVLPNTSEQGAVILAERIRRKIEDQVFACDSGQARLTVSIGAAVFSPGSAGGPGTMVKQALDALSKAMAEGGNRVALPETGKTNP